MELLVRYDSINNLCPSDVFNDYLLELSTCQVLDIESVYCDIKDITSTTTIETVPPSHSSISRRRMQEDRLGFDIYIFMQISMEDENSLNDIIDRFINKADFPYQIDEKWKQNANHHEINVGDVLTISTGSETITPSPTDQDGVLTTFPGLIFNRSGDPFIEDVVTKAEDGPINVLEAMIIVVVSAAVLLLCLVFGVKCYNKNKKTYDTVDDPYAEGRSDNETDTQNILEQHGHSQSKRQLFENMNQNSERRQQSPQQDIRRIDQNGDEAENALSNVVQEEEEKVGMKQQHYIVEVDEKAPEDSLQKLLAMNGYAEFEDSDIREDQIALPLTPGNQTNAYHTRQDSGEWVLQKGPVISQIQTKKVK